MSLILLMNTLGGIALILVSIPLILRKIAPNSWYGFRTPETLENPALWYAANEYSGKWLVFVGACTILGSIGLAFWPGLDLDVYALASLGIFLAAFGLAIVQSIRFLRNFQDP
jgi:uncharacterized membrane protein